MAEGARSGECRAIVGLDPFSGRARGGPPWRRCGPGPVRPPSGLAQGMIPSEPTRSSVGLFSGRAVPAHRA
jgi:hypothetical protein